VSVKPVAIQFTPNIMVENQKLKNTDKEM